MGKAYVFAPSVGWQKFISKYILTYNMAVIGQQNLCYIIL
jgi:hypothetical protein